MRALLGSVMLLLLNLQPLAGAALCLRHRAARDGAACEAAMRMESDDGMQGMQAHQDAMAGGSDMPSMADECATAMACAAPAPIVTGALATLAFTPHLILSEAWPPAPHRTDAPAAPFFRPPIA